MCSLYFTQINCRCAPDVSSNLAHVKKQCVLHDSLLIASVTRRQPNLWTGLCQRQNCRPQLEVCQYQRRHSLPALDEQ
jgi:hypothetical protein